jgi:DNA-binding winged helix-turn-helix (wHTH) protein
MGIQTPAGSVRFGEFELDLRSGELFRTRLRVPLPEQPLRLLELLVEQAGAVVSREDLRARLWPADTFVDFEHGLNAAVKRLRGALRDSADNPRFIQTVPKRGYRFIAPVGVTPGVQAAAPESAKIEAGVSLHGRLKRGSRTVAGVIALASIVGLRTFEAASAFTGSMPRRTPARW